MTCRTCGRGRLAHLRYWVQCPAVRRAASLHSPTQAMTGAGCRCGHCMPGGSLLVWKAFLVAPTLGSAAGAVAYGPTSHSLVVFLLCGWAWLALGQAAARRLAEHRHRATVTVRTEVRA